MDPKAILAWLAQQLGIGGDADGAAGEADVTPSDDGTDDAPNLDAPQGGEGSDIRPDDAPTPDAENAPEAGAGVDNAEGEAADDEAETIPGSEVSEAEQRDSLPVLATENERLRTILADNGIAYDDDSAVEDGETVTPSTDVDAEDDYDDEAAQADIDAIKARNAGWDK